MASERCENRGHRVLAPAWPRMPGEVEEVRRDPSALNGLGLGEIVDHYGVAISPAQVKGVLRLPPAQPRATFPVLRNPANRNRTVGLTPKQFRYNFANTMAGGELDHTVPASVCKEAAKRLGKSEAVVDYTEFAGRPHFAGAPGWEAVADYALDWAYRHTGATAPA